MCLSYKRRFAYFIILEVNLPTAILFQPYIFSQKTGLSTTKPHRLLYHITAVLTSPKPLMGLGLLPLCVKRFDPSNGYFHATNSENRTVAKIEKRHPPGCPFHACLYINLPSALELYRKGQVRVYGYLFYKVSNKLIVIFGYLRGL